MSLSPVKMARSISPKRSSSRRGAVVFGASSNYALHPVKYVNATKKSILKVASLEDSLRSICCSSYAEKEPRIVKKKPSFVLQLGPLIQDSLHIRSGTKSTSKDLMAVPPTKLQAQVSATTQLTSTSCSSLWSLEDSDSDADSFAAEELLEEEDLLQDDTEKPHVHFSHVSCRFYEIAPDDNPSTTGMCAGIAFSGWKFTGEDRVSVDEYETNHRSPFPKTMQDLKLDVLDRRQRLLKAGASREQLIEYAKRIQKARIQRLQTAQEFSRYGKDHMARQERGERIKHFLARAIGLRSTSDKKQQALWDQAQVTALA